MRAAVPTHPRLHTTGAGTTSAPGCCEDGQPPLSRLPPMLWFSRSSRNWLESRGLQSKTKMQQNDENQALSGSPH